MLVVCVSYRDGLCVRGHGPPTTQAHSTNNIHTQSSEVSPVLCTSSPLPLPPDTYPTGRSSVGRVWWKYPGQYSDDSTFLSPG